MCWKLLKKKRVYCLPYYQAPPPLQIKLYTPPMSTPIHPQLALVLCPFERVVVVVVGALDVAAEVPFVVVATVVALVAVVSVL